MADNCGNSTNLIRKRTMKKSELKNIIKECVKEVIFEEGVLSGIITEVVGGLHASPPRLSESSAPPSVSQPRANAVKQEVLRAVAGPRYEDLKKGFPTLVCLREPLQFQTEKEMDLSLEYQQGIRD